MLFLSIRKNWLELGRANFHYYMKELAGRAITFHTKELAGRAIAFHMKELAGRTIPFHSKELAGRNILLGKACRLDIGCCRRNYKLRSCNLIFLIVPNFAKIGVIN